MKLTQTRCTGWEAVSNLTILFCLLLTVPWSRSAPVFCTETKLTASDNRAQLRFGTSVAIDSGLAAVGAPNETTGAVYTFALIGTNWVQTQKLTDPAPPCGEDAFGANAFGTSVAMQNDILVVGEPVGCPDLNLSGRAFVYRLIGGTWVLQQTLMETNPPFPRGDFGATVTVSGNTVVVGNPEDPAGPGFGAVSIFTNNGTSWNLQAKVTAPTVTSPEAFFGLSVALDGNTLLVGANTDVNQFGFFSGIAYVFVRNGTNWTLQQALVPPASNFAIDFGKSVALQGDTAVVGAPGFPTPFVAGGAFIFGRSGSSWVFEQELLATDTNNSVLSFGTSVSIFNGTIVVGAPFRVINGLTAAGGADIFQFNGASWVLVQQIAAFDASSGVQFGNAVDIGESGIIVGEPFDSTEFLNAGAAYIFSPCELVIVSASASPNRIFPPNHKLVPVTISVIHQGNDVTCKIISVTSNQPINGKGDGNTSPDWIITGDLTVLLRAERAGNIKTDRVYTITVQCADSFGNTATTNVRVTVP
ncbi:MAG: FG-GAP repeat protein, partial [Limisphaerales bacterium]